MQRLLINYTLVSPGQDYDAIEFVVHGIAQRYARADDSVFIVNTPYSPQMVELLLLGAIDSDDRYMVGPFSPACMNYSLDWVFGAQSSSRTSLEARRLLQEWRVAGLRKRRFRA
jgi:hypothetical protein